MRATLLTVLAMHIVSAGVAVAQPAPAPKDKAAAAGFGPDLPASAAGISDYAKVIVAPSGAALKPTPGTVVVRMGGRVNVQAGMNVSH